MLRWQTLAGSKGAIHFSPNSEFLSQVNMEKNAFHTSTSVSVWNGGASFFSVVLAIRNANRHSHGTNGAGESWLGPSQLPAASSPTADKLTYILLSCTELSRTWLLDAYDGLRSLYANPGSRHRLAMPCKLLL